MNIYLTICLHIYTDIQCPFESNPAWNYGTSNMEREGYENRCIQVKVFASRPRFSRLLFEREKKHSTQSERANLIDDEMQLRATLAALSGALQLNSFRARTFTVRKIEENNYDYLDVPSVRDTFHELNDNEHEKRWYTPPFVNRV